MCTTTINTFTCADCERSLPVQTSGGTGYAVADDDTRICYDCCAKRDLVYMRGTGRITLYLVRDEVTNWPGSLRFRVRRSSASRTNWGHKRIDVWFTGPDGFLWHGVQVGDNSDLCRCRRTKNVVHQLSGVQW